MQALQREPTNTRFNHAFAVSCKQTSLARQYRVTPHKPSTVYPEANVRPTRPRTALCCCRPVPMQRAQGPRPDLVPVCLSI